MTDYATTDRHQDDHIDLDERTSGPRAGAFAACLVGGAVGGFFLGALPQGALVGGAAGLFAHGWVHAEPVPHRATYHNVWTRPRPLRIVVAVLALAAVVWLLVTGDRTETQLIASAVVTALALAPVWLGLPKPYTDPEDDMDQAHIDLARWYPGVLDQCGLSVTSNDLYRRRTERPDTVGDGIDDRGRAYVVVRPVAGSQTVDDFKSKADVIAGTWRLGKGRVIVTPDEPDAHDYPLVRLTVDRGETKVSGMVAWEPLDTNVDIVDYLTSLPVGLFVKSGDVYAPNLTATNLLVGGMPGAGKTGFLDNLVASVARHPAASVIFVDPKGGTEGDKWQGRVSLVLAGDGTDGVNVGGVSDLDVMRQRLVSEPGQDHGGEIVHQVIDLFAALSADMSGRRERARAAGVNDVYRQRFLSPAEPFRLVVIDEFALLVGEARRLDSANGTRPGVVGPIYNKLVTDVAQFIREARAYGYVVVLAAQRPTTDTVPAGIRGLIGSRVAFQSDEGGMHAILGSGYIPRTPDGDPTTIDRSLTPGQAVVVVGNNEGDGAKGHRVQVAYLDPARVPQVVGAATIPPFTDPDVLGLLAERHAQRMAQRGAAAPAAAEAVPVAVAPAETPAYKPTRPSEWGRL